MNKHGFCFRKVVVSTVCAMLSAISWAYESNATTAGVDEYPSGAPVIPPKPKAVAWVDESAVLHVGSLVVPPKPKARDCGGTGVDEYPTGTPVVPPKPKARDDGELGLDEYPTGSPVIPPKPKSNMQY